MSELNGIIGSLYEIIEPIGKGGGGKVYLARHIRLDKQVAVKVDTRRLSRDSSAYSREISVLRELKNDHIPQVYDFFEENGMVCSVMEYIRGESLDRPLKRGEVFSQAQVISWTKQILEALIYLHSPVHGDPPKGYVHSDIKPANIMRLPDNNICLIDFNITLALGEYSFIGRSAGYSSPEHYGYDFSKKGQAENNTHDIRHEPYDEDMTQLARDETYAASVTPEGSPVSHSIKRVLPDARSDIYSVGATMYHLLSGVKPDIDARKVTPLSADKFSAPLVKIISKAMMPDPDERFQTAKEMLEALDDLKKNDPRTIRLARQQRVAYTLCGLFLTTGIFTSFVGIKRMQTGEEILKNAEYSMTAYSEGDRKKAISYALDALPQPGLFTPKYNPKAQYALVQALGVYDLTDEYRHSGIVSVDRNVTGLILSPDGKTGAALTVGLLYLFDTATGNITAKLDTVNRASYNAVFIDDSRIVYPGKNGITLYDINAGIVWTGDMVTQIAVSGDGQHIAGAGEYEAYVYDLNGSKEAFMNYNGRKLIKGVQDEYVNSTQSMFSISDNGRYLAMAFEDGVLIYDILSDEDIHYEEEYCKQYSGGFYGRYLALSMNTGNTSRFVVIDIDSMEIVTEADIKEGDVTAVADDSGIYLKNGSSLVRFDPESREQYPLVGTGYHIRNFDTDADNTVITANDRMEVYDSKGNMVSAFDEAGSNDMCAVSGGYIIAGSIDSMQVKIYEKQDKSDSTILKYDQYMHDEARICSDESSLMLFSAYGLRSFSRDGSLVNEQRFDEPENVFDTQFVRENNISELHVQYTDGRELIYDDTGQLKDEQSGIPPDTVTEVFETRSYKIVVPYDQMPSVYNKDSGKLVGMIETEDQMTYVTEYKNMLICQFYSTTGERYGVIYDDSLYETAYLPYLSDVYNDRLIFDIPSGEVRETKIYDLSELMEMARRE